MFLNSITHFGREFAVLYADLAPGPARSVA